MSNMQNIRKQYRSLVKDCNTAEDKARELEKKAINDNGKVICEEKFLEWVEAMRRYNNIAYKIDGLSDKIFK